MRLIDIARMIHEAFPQMDGIRSVQTGFEESPDSAPKTFVTVNFNDGECYQIEVKRFHPPNG